MIPYLKKLSQKPQEFQNSGNALSSPKRQAWKNAAFHPQKRNPLLVFVLLLFFFFCEASETRVTWRTDVDGADADDVFHQRSSSCAIVSYAQLCVVWERCDREVEGEYRRVWLRETKTALAAIVSLAWAAAACPSSGCYRGWRWWWCWWLWWWWWWWWKLCVFLCHIPIYINLVFAMTDDICQCQTFSFSISASKGRSECARARRLSVPGKGTASPGAALKVTCPKSQPSPANAHNSSADQPTAPRTLPLHTQSPAPGCATRHGRRPTHEFDEFDVKYFRCFPHFFYKKHFLGIRIGFWARPSPFPLGHLLAAGVATTKITRTLCCFLPLPTFGYCMRIGLEGITKCVCVKCFRFTNICIHVKPLH